MIEKHKSSRPFCNEFPTDCSFEIQSYPVGTTVHNDSTNINYLIFCCSGHARITSTLFHDEILCAGEVMFVPRMSEYTGIALSDMTLLVHKFNNTVCQTEKCIFLIFIRTVIGSLQPSSIVASCLYRTQCKC